MMRLTLQQKMERSGFEVRTVSVDHLEDVRRDVEAVKGEVDATLWKDSLSHFRYELPQELPDAESIIVVARPQPSLAVTLRHGGENW